MYICYYKHVNRLKGSYLIVFLTEVHSYSAAGPDQINIFAYYFHKAVVGRDVVEIPARYMRKDSSACIYKH